jgi:hypothetical protein
MCRALLVAATLIGGMSSWAALAQQSPGTPPEQRPPAPPSQAGQTDAGTDPANADRMGATGWTGSWTANDGTQQDDPGTATTNQTKPMPPVPSSENPQP